MKYLLPRLAALACAFLAYASLRAQLPTLNVTHPNYIGTRLFDSTPGYVINGLGVDTAGNVFYIESDYSFSGNTTLYKRSAVDNYATATPLFDFGAAFIYGSFVLNGGGKIYFGDSTGAIRSINPNGTGLDVLGTVSQNSDAALVGGSLYISQNPASGGPTEGRVTKFALVPETSGDGGQMLGTGTTIVNANGDYAGALAYSGDNLYYGATGQASVKGLYLFSAGEVASPGPTGLTLTGHAFGATQTNLVVDLALGNGVDLWKDDDGVLRIFDRSNGGTETVGVAANGNYNLGDLDFAGNSLFVNVSDFGAGQSSVFMVSVPEPSSALLLLSGLALCGRRRH